MPVPHVRRDDHQPVGLRVGQRLEQHRVDHAENGGACADTERERYERGDRERRIFAQRANAESEVAQPSTHGISLVSHDGRREKSINCAARDGV